MTSLDILFWLIALLLGGSICAVEAGLANRHRVPLLSCMGSGLLSMLIIMFWVEDKTELVPFEKYKVEKTKGQKGERGRIDFGPGGDGGGDGGGGDAHSDNGPSDDAHSDGGGGGGARDGAGGGAGGSGGDGGGAGAGGGGRGDPADELLAKTVEYSRLPFRDCPTCPDVVIVPKGVAQVGVGPGDVQRQPNERPVAAVPMPRPLAVGRLEILRVEFNTFAEETGFQTRTQCEVGKRRGVFNWQRPGFEQDERHPVVCLSWSEVRLYLAWLSKKSGRTYRLPTEQEWEHAARAGTDTPFYVGTSLDRLSANVGRSRDGTTAGGLFGMNPWGLSDMIGNTWEMTAQCEYEAGSVSDLRPEQHDCRRLLKGGAWSSQSFSARHAARRFINEGIAANDIGFRVVRDVDERDNDKILTLAQKRELAQAERDAAEISARERQALEDEKRKALEEAEAAKKKAAAKK